MTFVLLILASLAVGPQIALAQGTACHTIRRGDTVAQLAQRLTGDAENRRIVVDMAGRIRIAR